MQAKLRVRGVGLSACLMACLVAPCKAIPAAADAGPAGHWTFDGTEPWADERMPGAAVTGAPPDLVEGALGKAAHFGGRNHLKVPDPDGRFNFVDGSFTIEALLKPSALHGSPRIVCYYDNVRGDPFRHYELVLIEGRPAYRIGDRAAVEAERAVLPGKWTHVAMVADGEEVTFYVDHEPAGRSPQPPMPQGGPLDLHIGSYTGGSHGYRGRIDELKLWNQPVRKFERPALKLGSQKVLFLDERYVERKENIRRVLHQPAKHTANPVLRCERPWEKNGVGAHDVLYDPERGLFQMWYRSIVRRGTEMYSDRGQQTRECYATSRDGVTWQKPSLGLVEIDVSRDNNCIHGGGGIVPVQHIPADLVPIARLARLTSRGRFLEFSDDGILWKRVNTVPVKEGKPYLTSMVFDAAQQRYYGYGQDNFPRQVWGRYSEDLLRWSDPFPVLAAGPEDPAGLEFYTMTMGYVDEGLFIGLLWAYHSRHGPGNDPPHPRQYGTIDIELAVSWDGLQWQRVAPNQPFIPTGTQGVDWDRGMILMARAVRLKDKVHFYYEGWSGDHGTRDRTCAVGLAVLPRDRFLSLTPEDPSRPAVLTTPALQLAGGHLWVNADAANGMLRAAVLTPDGKPVSGYAAADCTPLRGDAPDQRVTWTPAAKLPAGLYRLAFTLSANAHLYAFGAGR